MKKTRNTLVTMVGVLALAMIGMGTFVSVKEAFAQKKPPKTKVDTPTITCGETGRTYIDVVVCAPSGTGATGAPAGFSVHWTTKAALDANNGIWPPTDGVNACGASFSGNANDSRYSLAPGGCATVRIGEITLDSGASTNCSAPLICGTQYVFRVFAHATNTLARSDFSGNQLCSTAACEEEVCDPCVKSFGFWKTHYPADWPVDVLANGMTVGCRYYTADQLESILLTEPKGNGLIALAHQVINTRLNLAGCAGADYATAVQEPLAEAEALMCTTDAVPPVGTGSLAPKDTDALTFELDSIRDEFECSPTP